MELTLNGVERQVAIGWKNENLLTVLREHLGLPGNRFSCGIGQCGACILHVDGAPIMSDRAVVDYSFSIAFKMTFKDKASLSAYNADPYHEKISSEVTLPHVVRGLIYDCKTP